jgi:hypothetical protein
MKHKNTLLTALTITTILTLTGCAPGNNITPNVPINSIAPPTTLPNETTQEIPVTVDITQIADQTYTITLGTTLAVTTPEAETYTATIEKPDIIKYIPKNNENLVPLPLHYETLKEGTSKTTLTNTTTGENIEFTITVTPNTPQTEQ